jgi:cytochrome P450
MIYRLFCHPLARFPGPKLAAVTSRYEIYFDVIRDGSFIWEIERLHAKYGPIIRINPSELHVEDSNFFSTIYSGPNHKRDKDATWAMMAGAPRSAFSTPSHDVRKIRRTALNLFFSKRTVSMLEPRIASKVALLCARQKESIASHKVIHMHTAMSSFTMAVISEYCYGTEGCTNYLLNPECKPS